MPKAKPPTPDNLAAYRAKRRAAATPEPFGGSATDTAEDRGRRLFVVQQHAAARMHWDFRLEVDNALASWAVPKGPSMNPRDKRFAVQVENHPVEYADFEGSIPAGNYGAGQVIVWDHGTYAPLADFDSGLADGKLLFHLAGHKLKGRFTLVRPKGDNATGNAWLLVKERDQWASEAALGERSVFSGLTVAELKEVGAVEARLRADVEAARPRPPRSASLREQAMLAKPSEPFDRAGWVFEIKYDGYRLFIERSGDAVTLRSRNNQDLTARFPELARCARHLPMREFVIDSEVVVHDERGVPSFARLQRRAAVRGALATAQAARHDPVMAWAFDLPHAGGYDLKRLPLLERKRLLKALLPPVGPLRYSAHVEADGVETFNRMAALGLEGVVGKRADSPYRGGRSDDWLKVRATRSGDFVIAGWAPTKSDANDLGALALAEYRDGTLAYCGRVGAGLGDAQRREVARRLRDLAPGAPLVDDAAVRWVAPTQVCEVAYREYSRSGHLRQPAFLRLRDDKAAAECVGAFDAPAPAPPPPKPALAVHVTNRAKVFFPEKALTKGDLLDYYERVAPWMLPYLADRPLVLTRFPDGIHGKSFYQRDAPAFVPDWVERKTLWSDSAQREVRYLLAQNVESLLYLANMGAISIHAWHSRITDLAHPDWCVLDLDPKDAPFEHVLEAAKTVKALLDEVDLPGFLKTSGASGLHILLPLAGQLTHALATTLGELLARITARRRADICTTTRAVRGRGRKVYVDHLQNGHGQLLVTPFSARAEPAASVSMPVKWTELTRRLKNANHHIVNAPTRLRRMGDPMSEVLSIEPDLPSAMARLADVVRRESA